MAKNRYFADISSNNAWFSAKDYKAGGHLLVAIKATQGHNYVNPDYAKWVEMAHSCGLVVLHYHFAETDDAVGEANHFLATVQGHFGKRDSLVLDLETPKANAVAYRQGFDAELFRHGHKSILYSYAAYLREHGSGLRPASGKIWVADYETHPQGGWWGKSWAWQRTDGTNGPNPHSCMGIGKCDVSEVNPATFIRLRLGR
jgi:lysozyme